jgi:hypothetical protein
MAIMSRPFAPPPVRPATLVAAPLRRCTFRRVTTTAAGPRALPIYEVACTFPDRRVAIPLGDIEAARPVCEACTYQGIFRPDSD